MRNEVTTYGAVKGMRSFPHFSFPLLITHFSFLICFCFCLPASSFAQDTARRYDTFFLDAICQREKGNSDAAFDLLRHCVEIDSTRSEAFFYLAQYYAALKKRNVALRYMLKAVELEPENGIYLETLATAYVNQRQYDEAVALLERLSALRHDRDDVLGMLVQLYQQLGDYDNAISALSRLETLEGKNERISYAKSGLYTQKGDKKAAIAEMKQLADQYPNDNNYRCMYANTLYLNGQKKKAVAIFERILREEADNQNAQMAMLAYYSDIKDSVRRSDMLERALFNRNVTSETRLTLMRQVIEDSEQSGGDSVRVLRMFDRLLSLPQSDADMTLFCASYMNMKKMPNDSIRRVLEQALALSPDNAAVRLQLVSYAWQSQERQRVIELCSDARRYNPDEMAFYYYQGIAYYQEEQLDKALDAFQNGIGVISQQSDPAIVSDFYAVMGDILHQKGMDREAFAAYDSCLAWKDDNIGCLNNYAYYLSVKDRDLDKAERMSYRTIKAEPQNATYLDTYAWILFRQKRYEEAKTYIDLTLRNDTDSSSVLLEHAGDIYYYVGDTERAEAYWQQALDRDDDDDGSPRRQVLIRKIKLRKYIEE